MSEQLTLPLSPAQCQDPEKGVNFCKENSIQDLTPLASDPVSLAYRSLVSLKAFFDGALGNTVLDYRETLPDDILPLVVLDASARVRATYTLWESGREGLHILPSATKRYDDLTVNVWQNTAT